MTPGGSVIRGIVYVVSFAWSLIPSAPPGAASPVRVAVEVTGKVLAVEAAVSHRLPADPTAADHARLETIRDAALQAALDHQLNPWAVRRFRTEAEASLLAAVAAKGTPTAARKRERAQFLFRLGGQAHNPK